MTNFRPDSPLSSVSSVSSVSLFSVLSSFRHSTRRRPKRTMSSLVAKMKPWLAPTGGGYRTGGAQHREVQILLSRLAQASTRPAPFGLFPHWEKKTFCCNSSNMLEGAHRCLGNGSIFHLSSSRAHPWNDEDVANQEMWLEEM